MEPTVKTVINGGLVINELRDGIRFGTDALLLADFVGRVGKAAELGTGSGVVSLLVLSSTEGGSVAGIELDENYAAVAAENARENQLADRFSCVCDDVKNVANHFECGSFDCVFSNPPYLKPDCGKKNASPSKFSAFHETTADIDDFVCAAAYLLKYGGRFCAVYRPEYLSRLLRAMERFDIRTKRLRLVYPSYEKPPCLVLAEGKKGARDGLIAEPPFFIYADGSHTDFSPSMNRIYAKFSYISK